METTGVEVDRIEDEVNGILARVPGYVWDGEFLPVPVEDIVADVFGLLVRLVEDLSAAPGCEGIPPEELSGLLLTGPGEIWVNAAEARQWEGRRRFTIGHELGHYVMHQNGRHRVFCRSIVEGGEPPEEPGSESRLVGGARSVPELEANAFAAALMMPRHLVLEQCESHDRDVDLLCAVFGASEKAMRYRLEAMETWD